MSLILTLFSLRYHFGEPQAQIRRSRLDPSTHSPLASALSGKRQLLISPLTNSDRPWQRRANESWCLLMQDNTQEGRVDVETVIVVLNEAECPEFIHEKV